MEELYKVYIEQTNCHEIGIESNETIIICRKCKNGTYQDIKTNLVYGSSIIKVEKLI